MSTFSSLNAASTALWAQRHGLDVTGQNIANVNTDGYSRQRADLEAMGGTAVPAFYSVSQGVGSGVSVEQVTRIRDAFLEGRAHTEHATAAQLTVESDAYDLIQQAFREPGETGVQSLLSDMWAGWGDVANNPQDLPARSQLLQRTEMLVSGMRSTRSALDEQWQGVHESLTALVTDVNSAAAGIATLNQAIQRATQTGQTANELSDKRDVLVLKLAQQIGATVRPAGDGVLDVLVGGVTLVAGATAATLAVAGPTAPDSMTASDQPRVVALPGGHAAGVGGTAAGQLNVLNRLVPDSRKALDDVATALVTQVNALHRQGHDLDGVKDRDLLGPVTGPITAANIAVRISDPRQLGVAALAPDATGPSADNGIANAFADLRLRADGADTVYRGKIVDLGVQAAVSERNLDMQTVVTASVDASRESVAGVNLDEEMASMLQFQHAYGAAARMVTAIDEALDTLINRTGVVGR